MFRITIRRFNEKHNWVVNGGPGRLLGYVRARLASENNYPVIVYSVTNYRTHLIGWLFNGG